MSIPESQKSRLAELRRSIAGGELISAGEVIRSAGRRERTGKGGKPAGPVPLAELCKGSEIRVAGTVGRQSCWLVRRSLSEVVPQWRETALRYGAVMRGVRRRVDDLEASAGLAQVADSGPEDLLFVDIETCGLRAARVFLVGTMYFVEEELIFDQFFARDYAEEAALLQAFLRRYAEAGAVVTFNGKAFDINVIRERAALYGLRLPSREPPHLDLLHASRRRWRGVLPNCKLQTLERYLCGRHRPGDIPGSAIPDVYHRYVETGDARRIGEVLHHNLLDMLTMAELLCLLLMGSDPLDL